MRMVVCLLTGGETFRRYEAKTADANVCFTYENAWQSWEREDYLQVSYNITSEEIIVRMNLRSIISNSILRSRLLPARFKLLNEYCGNLTEPYEIEFCASSGIIGESTDASAPASATIFDVSYIVADAGGCLLFMLYSIRTHSIF